MRFTSCKSGILLTASHFIFIGAVLSLALGYFFIWAGFAMFAIILICAFLLSYRLSHCNVSLRAHILRVEKGRWFPLVLRVPIKHITGIHLLQTPMARRLGVCHCIVYTSGLTFVLLAIKYNDAATLCEASQTDSKKI